MIAEVLNTVGYVSADQRTVWLLAWTGGRVVTLGKRKEAPKRNTYRGLALQGSTPHKRELGQIKTDPQVRCCDVAHRMVRTFWPGAGWRAKFASAVCFWTS